MRAVPLAMPLAWTGDAQEDLQRARNWGEIGSDCLAHQEIFR